jgi:multiple sugar transport system permease protein
MGGGTAATSHPPRPRRLAGRRVRRQAVAWAFAAPVVAYLVAFYGYPLYRNVDLSVRNYTVMSFVHGHAPYVGLQNYRADIRDVTFSPALFHTLVFTFVSIAFQFVIGLGLAVFFNKRFHLSATLRALFLVPWLLPLIVSASTWSWMLNSDSGVVNYGLHLVGLPRENWLTAPHWALVSVIIANIWIGIPFNLVVLYSGLQAIPGELLEAAALDGANAWQRFRRVTFPLLRPVTAITLLLGLVYTLKVFDIIWIMTRGGPADASTTFSTWSYRLGFGSFLPSFGTAAAVSNMLIVLTLCFSLVYFRIQRRRRFA